MMNKLYGDGIHDDTAAIQEMLDSGEVLIKLPVPERHYLISATLRIHSYQELVLSRWSEVRLAPKSNCPMLANSSPDDGNECIAVRGGIWNFDNVNQAPNPQKVTDDPELLIPHGKFRKMPVPADYPVDPVDGMRHGVLGEFGDMPYHPDRYWGNIFQFTNIDRFEMSDVVMKNPVSYAVKCAKLTNFTFNHITFDFNEGNPSPDNMDGLHFDGFCRNGKISDLKGTCYDDLIALNAEDGIVDSPGYGPIENIEIDSIFSDNCHSIVRMLSCGSRISNISIRNVYGSFYRYAVGFTHFFPENPTRGVFDNIVLENLFISKALPPESDWNGAPDWALVWCEGHGDIGSLRINGFHRVEKTTPVPSIEIEQNFTINTLTVTDCSIANHLAEPIVMLRNHGTVSRLYYDGCRVAAGEVADLENNGKIISK